MDLKIYLNKKITGKNLQNPRFRTVFQNCPRTGVLEIFVEKIWFLSYFHIKATPTSNISGVPPVLFGGLQGGSLRMSGFYQKNDGGLLDSAPRDLCKTTHTVKIGENLTRADFPPMNRGDPQQILDIAQGQKNWDP